MNNIDKFYFVKIKNNLFAAAKNKLFVSLT